MSLIDYESLNAPDCSELLCRIRFCSDSFVNSTHQSDSCQKRVRFFTDRKFRTARGLSERSDLRTDKRKQLADDGCLKKDAHGVRRHVTKEVMRFCALCAVQTANIVHSVITSDASVLCVPSCELFMSRMILQLWFSYLIL